ncbi:hypothetical protein MAR_019117, partial [Mya arenaria]
MPVSGHTQVSELCNSSVPLLQGLSGSPRLTPHQEARPPSPSTQQTLSYQERALGIGGGSGSGGAQPDRARGPGIPGLDPDLTAEFPHNRPSPMIGGEPVGACAVTAGQPESMPVSGNTLVKELYSSFVQLLQGCSGSPGLHPHQHTIIILPSTQNALVYKQSAQGLGGGSGPGVAPPDRARGSGLPDQDLNAESPYNRPSPMIGGESVGACAVTA